MTLQREYAGMLALAKDCPRDRGELAYVTSTAHNAVWYGKGLHQAHETFAAMCLLDTPVTAGLRGYQFQRNQREPVPREQQSSTAP